MWKGEERRKEEGEGASEKTQTQPLQWEPPPYITYICPKGHCYSAGDPLVCLKPSFKPMHLAPDLTVHRL